MGVHARKTFFAGFLVDLIHEDQELFVLVISMAAQPVECLRQGVILCFLNVKVYLFRGPSGLLICVVEELAATIVEGLGKSVEDTNILGVTCGGLRAEHVSALDFL